MSVLAGPFAIACMLLAIGGVLKGIRPGDTANALRSVGLPLSRTSVRALVRSGGVLESALAVAAVTTGEPLLATLVAASYVCFTGFVVLALRSGRPISSCGC